MISEVIETKGYKNRNELARKNYNTIVIRVKTLNQNARCWLHEFIFPIHLYLYWVSPSIKFAIILSIGDIIT